MTFHTRVSRIVLGRRLVKKTDAIAAAATRRLDVLECKTNDVCREITEAAKECGLASHGSHA